MPTMDWRERIVIDPGIHHGVPCIKGTRVPVSILDVFLLMQEEFDRNFASLPPAQRCVFEHERARLLFEADVFWATEAIGAEVLTSWLSVYQLSRDMVERGIVEVIFDD